MTALERDRIAKKIVDGIIDHLANKSDLDDGWDELEDEDQKNIKDTWLAIAKRFIPVDGKSNDTNRRNN